MLRSTLATGFRLAGLWLAAQASLGRAAEPQAVPFFPCGAMHMSTISHWQHHLPPLDEYAAYLDADFAKMKAVHFNSVAVHVDWYDIETAEGRFEFDRLDLVMRTAEKHGLKVLLWPWAELQPDWVVRNYPDSEMIASDHYRPAVACWDHPHVRWLVDRFIRTVVTRYRNRPSLLAWDVGAEAGVWVASINNPVDQARANRLYCYCDHTRRKYRAWLQGRYGSIERLNAVWATHYDDWSQVDPVRTGIFERAQVFWMDWRTFMLENVAGFQQLKADAARAADPNHPITAHIGGWGSGYVYASADEYRIGRHFDILSLSLFPYWIAGGLGWYEGALAGMQLDGVRSAGDGKPMWVEELQGGPSVNGLAYRSPFPRPQDVRLWVWQSVAHGATGIFYWNWRPETTGIEASGFGLVNYDGSLTDRARAAGELASQLDRHADLLRECRPAPAQVAIFHSPRNSIQAFGEGDESHYAASVRGIYRALWRAGLPVDILVPQQLLTCPPDRYRVVYLPFAYTLTRAEGDWLRRFVERGGTLYAELWCGLKDERTFLYETVPGAGLAEVLGCREELVCPAQKPSVRILETHPAIGELEPGTVVPGWRWQERIQILPGGQVLARFENGDPALVAATHGKGATLYAATMLCRSFDLSLDPALLRLLTGPAEWAGVRPPVSIEREPKDALVEARVLQGADRRLLIVINHTETKAVAWLTPGDTAAQVSEFLTGRLVVPADGTGRIRIELGPSEVRPLLVRH